MMAGRGTGFTAAGGPARHIPVMLTEILETLQPRDGDIIVDGTFGAGGYSEAIVAAANCKVIAIDQDPDALACGRELIELSRGRLVLALGRYSDMAAIAAAEGFISVDGVVLDLGVSSMQLDQKERGFSFLGDGPLDMRMGKQGPSASDVVNALPEQDLAEIITVFGEERRARAIARAIVKRRSEQPILRTDELAGLVAGVLGRKRDELKHPATRTFQALRLYVNDELAELARGLSAAELLLKAGGRLVVVTFHSLEDRIAKRFFAIRSLAAPKGSRHLPDQKSAGLAPSFTLVNRRPLIPSKDELRANPRARSAHLRAAVRTGAPAHALDFAALGVPDIGRLMQERRFFS